MPSKCPILDAKRCANDWPRDRRNTWIAPKRQHVETGGSFRCQVRRVEPSGQCKTQKRRDFTQLYRTQSKEMAITNKNEWLINVSYKELSLSFRRICAHRIPTGIVWDQSPRLFQKEVLKVQKRRKNVSMETSVSELLQKPPCLLNSGAVVDLTSTFVTSLQLSKCCLNPFRFLALADSAQG